MYRHTSPIPRDVADPPVQAPTCRRQGTSLSVYRVCLTLRLGRERRPYRSGSSRFNIHLAHLALVCSKAYINLREDFQEPPEIRVVAASSASEPAARTWRIECSSPRVTHCVFAPDRLRCEGASLRRPLVVVPAQGSVLHTCSLESADIQEYLCLPRDSHSLDLLFKPASRFIHITASIPSLRSVSVATYGLGQSFYSSAEKARLPLAIAFTIAQSALCITLRPSMASSPFEPLLASRIPALLVNSVSLRSSLHQPLSCLGKEFISCDPPWWHKAYDSRTLAKGKNGLALIT